MRPVIIITNGNIRSGVYLSETSSHLMVEKANSAVYTLACMINTL